jgi:hypothetical protein
MNQHHPLVAIAPLDKLIHTAFEDLTRFGLVQGLFSQRIQEVVEGFAIDIQPLEQSWDRLLKGNSSRKLAGEYTTAIVMIGSFS